MHNHTKLLSVLIFGVAIFGLTALTQVPTQAANSAALLDITQVQPVRSKPFSEHDHIDDQYEVFVKPDAQPFQAKDKLGYIKHGHENALRWKQLNRAQ